MQNPKLCEQCHPICGCGEQHSFTVADTGVCGRCGQVNEVWDCEVLKLYRRHNIPDDQVYRSLPRIMSETTVEQLQSEIDIVMRTAETGEQWAEICRLEAIMIDMVRVKEDRH